MAAIVGVAMLAVSFVLLRAFRGRQGETAKRSDWIDVLIALVVTMNFGGGAILFIVGAFGLLSSNF
jgi:hypothetical protein